MGPNGLEESSFSLFLGTKEQIPINANTGSLGSEINALVEYLNQCKH